MSKKHEPLFRVSAIVKGADNLDSVLRAFNGCTIYPPLTEPYTELPATVAKRKELFIEGTLRELVHTRLKKGDTLSTELAKIARDNGFSPGNVSKAAQRAGGTYNMSTKTWSLKDNA